MREKKAVAGFTLIEVMVAAAIFSLMVVAIFQVLVTAQNSMKVSVAKDSAETAATRVFTDIGRDVRESSYPYIFAGDWRALKGAGGGVSITVARNYFSSAPQTGGNTFALGIATEGWGQCQNPSCNWCNHMESGGLEPTLPHAFLDRPIRNNAQVGSPIFPPPSLAFNFADAGGRLFGHMAPGQTCPFCQTTLGAEAYFGGLMVFSPRRNNNTFSYGGTSGYEVRWESMIFYCPFRAPNTGICELRRYVFFASDIAGGAGPASLIDLLDFDLNGIIESPPMTDANGDFVLDAQGEQFSLIAAAGGGNALVYSRWDNNAGRTFRIEVNRATGVANVTINGGPFAGTTNLNLQVKRFGPGVSDFDASTFINNPSFLGAGGMVNPTGVVEFGVVRITVQIDRPGVSMQRGMGREETVQTTMLRPRN